MFSILTFFGIKVRELHFHLGDIEKSQNSSLYVKGVQLADALSTDLSKKVIENNYLSKLNHEFDRNTVQLRLAKCFMTELFPFCLKVILLQEDRETYTRQYIQKPYLLSWDYINDSAYFEGIDFYSEPFANLKGLSNVAIRYLRVRLRIFYIRFRSYIEKTSVPTTDAANIILSLKEDSISSNQSNRNQQFWIEDSVADYTYYILDQSWKFSEFSSIKTFGNTHSLPLGVVGRALRLHGQDRRLMKVSQSQFKNFLRVIVTGNTAGIFAFLNVLILLTKSIEIGSLALLVNANKYVFKETHGVDSDAIQLISNDLGVSTYAIQYSNLVEKNCWMYSTADKFLIFSERYKTIFSNEFFSPMDFIVTGYPYREVIKYVEKSATELEERCMIWMYL